MSLYLRFSSASIKSVFDMVCLGQPVDSLVYMVIPISLADILVSVSVSVSVVLSSMLIVSSSSMADVALVMFVFLLVNALVFVEEFVFWLLALVEVMFAKSFIEGGLAGALMVGRLLFFNMLLSSVS